MKAVANLSLPITLALLSTLATGTAFAACEAPNYSIKVPSGATATKDEMMATKRSVADYNAAMTVYAACLKQDEDAAVAAAGDKATDEQKQKIHNKFVDLQNKEMDKLQAVVDSFNAEVRAYKAKNPPPPAN